MLVSPLIFFFEYLNCEGKIRFDDHSLGFTMEIRRSLYFSYGLKKNLIRTVEGTKTAFAFLSVFLLMGRFINIHLYRIQQQNERTENCPGQNKIKRTQQFKSSIENHFLYMRNKSLWYYDSMLSLIFLINKYA